MSIINVDETKCVGCNACVRVCPAPDAAFWGNERLKLKAMGLDGISLNKEVIDLRYVEQLVDTEQLNALGYLLRYAGRHLFDGKSTLAEIAERLGDLLEEKGLSFLEEGSYLPVGLAMPRKQEILACLNRFRSLKMTGWEMERKR